MTKAEQPLYTLNDVVSMLGEVANKLNSVVTVKINDVMDRIDFMGRSLENKIDTHRAETTEFFEAMKKDFDRLDDKVDKINARLIGVEGRLTGVEGRLTGVEGRLTAVDVRLGDVEVACAQNTRAIFELDQKMTDRFDRLEKNVYQDINAIGKTLIKHDSRLLALEAAR